MTSSADIDRLSLRSPDALLSALPYLLGFHPQESVVAVWLRDGRLLLTQRIDLPGADTPLPAWVQALWGHAAARAADELVLVAVSGHPLPVPVIEAATEPAPAAGVRLRDVLRVQGDRWWSLLCEDATCCPPEGRRIRQAAADAVAAEFTGRGRAPMPARTDLVAQLAHDAGWSADVAARITAPPRGRGEREAWRDRMLARLLDLLSRAEPLDADAVADVASGLADIRVRDTLLWDATRWAEDDACRALDRLLECVRATPIGTVAPVATCAALVAWLLGDGARAQVALDRAQAADAGYSLALLLAASLRAGLPPSAWREAMGSLDRSACRHGRTG